MISLFIILITASISWHFSDIHSKAFIPGMLYPAIFLLSMLALFAWVASRFGSKDKRTQRDSGTSDGASGGDSDWSGAESGNSGDCGGGDGGGGGD